MSKQKVSEVARWPVPAGWQWTTVDGIGNVALGRQRSPANHNGPKMRRYLRAGNITWNGWDLSDVKEMNFDEDDFLRFSLCSGDVLVNEGSGSAKEVGKPAIWRGQMENCCFQNTLIRVKPIGCTSEYLFFYFLFTARSEGFVSSTQGVNIHHIGKNGLASFPVPVPSISEQQRVVAKIDSLSAKTGRARDHLDHLPRLVEKYKRAVLTAAFEGKLTRQWRRGAKLLPVQPRKQADIRAKFRGGDTFQEPYELPQGWRWLRLPEVGELDRGKSRHRPRNDPRLFGGKYPFIQTGEVRAADRYLSSCSETYNDFGLQQSLLWPVETVCITIAANIAETSILAFEACFPDSIVGFLADVDKVHAAYVEYFIRTARDDLSTFAPATAQKNINLDILSSVRVPVAPVIEQEEIVRGIDAAFNWIDRLASEATNARRLIDHLDQAVLAKAFRGELVPQDPDDEPASVLLERIKAERETSGRVTGARGRPMRTHDAALQAHRRHPDACCSWTPCQ
jgi:type I restriction enzyme S subunit